MTNRFLVYSCLTIDTLKETGLLLRLKGNRNIQRNEIFVIICMVFFLAYRNHIKKLRGSEFIWCQLRWKI